MDRLFVYGSLAPGRPNYHVLEDVPGHWEPATLKGILHEEGWGAELGYPGITPDENGEDVNGFVLESDQLDDVWPRLDEFEGDGYERQEVTVTVREIDQVSAYVYALRRE